MTYKSFKKIQVYILILLAYFILTKNFQLIFNTRNIVEIGQVSPKKVVFFQKTTENEHNTKYSVLLSGFLSSKQLIWANSGKYIKDKHKKSFSSVMSMLDRVFLWLKRLIDSIIYLIKKLLISVKYRYLFSQKALMLKREYFLKELEELVGSRGVPLVKGMLFGDLSGITQDAYHSFKVIGMLHILSASSANFTIFLQFIVFFLRPLFYLLDKKAIFCLNFLIITLYFCLVGVAASTMRAFFSLSLAFIATFLLERSFSSLHNLYLSGVFMLIINPFFLQTLGFQFSFLASFGIIFLYSFIEKELCICKNYLIRSIVLTICAQFFLLPILIFNFGEFNYLSILANLFILPLVSFLTILFLASFIALFLSSVVDISIFNSVLYFLITKTIDILFFLINILEKIPFKSIKFTHNKSLYTILILLITLLIIFVVYQIRNKKYSINKYRVLK